MAVVASREGSSMAVLPRRRKSERADDDDDDDDDEEEEEEDFDEEEGGEGGAEMAKTRELYLRFRCLFPTKRAARDWGAGPSR
jgi:hypothetical protein